LRSGASTYPKAETIEAVCSIADGTCAPVPFAVFNQDFYDPEEIYSAEATGVTERAGLMWPRVVGSRNGKTFSYSCSAPRIVRDAVNKDDPYMWTFYRYPFYPGFSTWTMGQGNNGGFTHTGSQKFAFDFGAPKMTEIRAARGGIVANLREDQIGNKYVFSTFMDDAELEEYCDTNKCQANWVLIRHEDGMETWYVHMPQNGVLPQKGQKVFRGDVIGYVGNTGYSTGPHLHFQEQEKSGYSTSSCFESSAPFTSAVLVPCFIPKKGDLLFSNNQ
jgi:murein DD-endopeptidase MepM/ murein hydrolase activator NlpD